MGKGKRKGGGGNGKWNGVGRAAGRGEGRRNRMQEKGSVFGSGIVEDGEREKQGRRREREVEWSGKGGWEGRMEGDLVVE